MENHADLEPADSVSSASRQLQSDAQQRASIADRLITPWWYHPILGLLIGSLIASHAFRSPLITGIGLALYVVGIGILVRSYKNKTGIWISGWRKGRAGVLALCLGAVALGGWGVAALIDWRLDFRAAFVIAGIVIAALTVVIGRAADEALRTELRHER